MPLYKKGLPYMLRTLTKGFFLYFAAAAIISAGARAQDLVCQSEKKYENELSLYVDVKIRHTKQKLTHINLESTTVVNATNAGYTCSAEFDVSDGSNQWKSHENITEIESPAPDPIETSRLTIKRTQKGYIIDTRGLSSSSCGAHAHWPIRVFVPFQGKQCLTKFD